MPFEHICPLCNGSQCYEAGRSSSKGGIWYDCKEYNISVKLDSDIDLCCNKQQKIKDCNLIFEHSVNNPSLPYEPWFYYASDRGMKGSADKAVDLSHIAYPQLLSEKTDRILLTLSRLYPKYGEQIPGDEQLERAFFCEESESEAKYLGIINIMMDMGYLKEGEYRKVVLTAKGWQQIDEAGKRYSSNKNCFVAIAFREETESIRRSIKIAAEECGYKPVIMDEVEHNGQIVPEMLYEIRRSRFLIMDTTINNLGAYYESGYAAGCGKEVILCCRKDKFESEDKPHFDIQQQSTIIWENDEDLVKKLKRRIEATVGKAGFRAMDF